MEDNTTRILKLANGESIVCTCIPTRIDEASPTLHVIHPLKMELKNKITKKGIVEALTLSRWLQPFTESDELDIVKSTIITNFRRNTAIIIALYKVCQVFFNKKIKKIFTKKSINH